MSDLEQTPGEQQSPSPAGESVNWEARYKGLVPKVDQLTTRNRDLEGQLATKSSEVEQLKAQLALKDTEKGAAVGERDKQLQEAVTKASTLETELRELRALKLKLEVAKELGRPDLMKIAERIPNMDDREALKTVLSDFASFADDAVKEREKQLLSGTTPGLSGAPAAPGLPTSEGEWMKHIEALPLGSPDREKAWNSYWTFLETKNKSK